MTASTAVPQGQNITEKNSCSLKIWDLNKKRGLVSHTVDYSLFRTRIREKSQEPGGSIVLGIILGFLLPPKQKTRKLIQITT